MSLREKILEQAKTLNDLNESDADPCKRCFKSEAYKSQYCQSCKYYFTHYPRPKFVSVGVVSGLLDKATAQINEKLSVSRKYIHTDDPWARRQARAEVNVLEWVLTVLGEGEGKQK